MNAQEIIEKIRAEIERLNTIQLKRIQEGDLVDAEPYGKNEAYNNVLSILSDLEKEEKPNDQEQEQEAYDPYKTTVHGILKMFESYSETTDKEDFIANIRVKCKDAVDYERVVQGEKPTTAEGLEEEINRMYAKDTTTLRTRTQYADLARHFAQWGAEHARECEECPSRGNTHSYLKGLNSANE